MIAKDRVAGTGGPVQWGFDQPGPEAGGLADVEMPGDTLPSDARLAVEPPDDPAGPPPVSPLPTGSSHGGAADPLSMGLTAPPVPVEGVAEEMPATPSGEPAAPPYAPAGKGMARSSRQKLVRGVANHLFWNNREYRRYGTGAIEAAPDAGRTSGVDFLFAVENEPHTPDEVFPRLRWGGVFVYVTRERDAVGPLAEQFKQRGYEVIRGPSYFRSAPLGVPLPFVGRRLHYLVARKTQLILPRQITDRFSYHVHLVRGEHLTGRKDDWVVCKEVPTLERVCARLKARFRDLPDATIERRAKKFTEKVFPIFLTREAAMLKILRRELPIEYIDRVPHVVEMERDDKGLVRVLRMNWLRNSLPKSGAPLTQLQFARQATELLAALHDHARVIHLDLRLDNIVITEHGVGFVDFGSSTRVQEDLSTPILSSIFTELMRTSQIQHMMGSMSQTGRLTSSAITDAYQKVDRAVDFFYLAVQINNPLANPDFRGLVEYDPNSEEARMLRRLTHDILKPPDPSKPLFRSAQDILAGIERVEQMLYGVGGRRV